MSRRAAGVLIVVVQFVLAHCAAAETHVVRITDFSYIPQDITIDEGDTVRWVWEAEQHNVVSGNVATFSKDGTFESEVEDTGYGYEVRFDRTLINAHRMAGNVYNYYCEPHAFMGMKGSITVRRQEKHFKAELRGWQEVPANESNETGSCSFTLDGDETELSVSCSHSISNPLASHIHQNVIGLSGPGVCGLQPTSPISQTCNALSSDTIDKLFTGGLYINVHTSAHPSGEIRGQIVVDAGGRSISGRVTDPNGNPLSGVRVSNGSAEQLSDTQGNYRIQNIENGVYQLTAHLSGQNIQPIRGVSPLLVNGTDGRNIDFTVVPMTACGTDSDLDGVCDREEESAGSDPDDPGSYPVSIQSPAYLLWNGFIGIRNIVEILNRGLSDLDLQLTLFDTTGQRLQHLEIRIAAEGQRDIILNDLPGFQLDAYGVLALEFAQERSADIEARMMYYRDDKVNGGFEFVAATPLEKPLYGSTAVGFNTHQPSLDPDERTNVVAQWLALVNLDTEKAKTFTVIKNDQLGQEIERRDYRVEPFGRIDLEGGHLVPGIDHVGLVRIVPHDLVAPYQAQLYRYGGNAASAFAPDSYRFAFPLLARAGNGALQYAPVSIGAGSSNWLEVAN
ncbi:MAG: CHRD domain-containing protein, partial [Bdellovibrionales bacterium]|nr:CHRD domain-containing protein [Bdellovibrionales bacterium]